MRDLFGTYRLRCGLASALNFSQAAVVYGVLSLMALVILPYMKVPAGDMPLYYVYGNAAALVGGLTASVLVEAWGRRTSLLVSYSFTVAAIVLIYLMHTLPGMVLGYCLIQFGVTWAYISGYVVSSEVLPTRIRATGRGVSVAVGRVGAMVVPADADQRLRGHRHALGRADRAAAAGAARAAGRAALVRERPRDAQCLAGGRQRRQRHGAPGRLDPARGGRAMKQLQ
ncbi:MAG: hypothetical protein VB138_06970 [Burkholderia sp.]